jgi:site-specific DNA-methyltransferase (cytosine-N4-specific)
MQPGEHVVMVVGGNRTGSGAHQTVIPTPELIGQLSTTRGFDYSELISLQTWARYGMHAKNAVSTEDAVVMTVTG